MYVCMYVYVCIYVCSLLWRPEDAGKSDEVRKYECPLSVSVCVCVYVFMYVYIYYVYVCMCMHVCMYVDCSGVPKTWSSLTRCANMSVPSLCPYVCVCMYVCVCAGMYVDFLNDANHVRKHYGSRLCMYVCMSHICANILSLVCVKFV